MALALFAFSCAEDIYIERPDDREDIRYDAHPRNAFYQAELTQYMQESLAPGSILLVKQAADDLWIGAVGKSNLAYQTPMRTTDQFRTGSVTKMLTSVVVLHLMEQDQLTLEDKLADLLPMVKANIPDTDKITVRHLLAHQSGIIDPPNESLSYQSDILNHPQAMYQMSVEETLEKYVYGKDLHFEPGTAYAYSNTNYWLLGLIAEKTGGKNLQQLMEDIIFTPLNMRDTYLEKRDDKNVVRGYADLYNDGHLMDVSLWDRAEGDGEADGGLISTAKDLYTFMYGLFTGQLLAEETLADMKKIQLEGCDNPYCEYGLGLEIWETPSGTAYGHNGGLIGIDANVLYFEDKDAILVLYKNEGRGIEKKILDRVLE
jgi:D-alanyl-D-alanine carboxypeptidase